MGKDNYSTKRSFVIVIFFPVSTRLSHRGVSISAEEVLNGVAWSEKLDEHFQANFEEDPTLTWQYFGSASGFFRNYPGEKKQLFSYWVLSGQLRPIPSETFDKSLHMVSEIFNEEICFFLISSKNAFTFKD